MTWEELKEKAKEMGAVVSTDMFAVGDILFWIDGVIDSYDVTIAKDRTYEQMYQIMEGLK